MPGLDGVEVIVALRHKGNTIPVLLLTARDTPSDRVRGLDSGADDYIVKPFDFDELLARLRAMLRRASGDGAPVIRTAGLHLDPATHEVRSGENLIQLTPREYAILEVLMRRAGKVVTRHSLAEHAWPDGEATWNGMEAHMARLRAKIGSGAGVSIVAVRGTGYRLLVS
jgi:DNA-binding response OmpR family regulator